MEGVEEKVRVNLRAERVEPGLRQLSGEVRGPALALLGGLTYTSPPVARYVRTPWLVVTRASASQRTA